jgi:hypothetical protein
VAAAAGAAAPARQKLGQDNTRCEKLRVYRGVVLRSSDQQEMARKVELHVAALMASGGWQR